jgi:signal transduction histidine kinase
MIDVTDDGPGIEASVLPRLFDPFFSTKKHGSGLGLALTQEIVRDHGGEITVETEWKRGATFSISLPAASAPAG